LLTALAVKASTNGKEKLIFSQKDRSRIGKQVVVAANEALVKHRAPELPSAVADSKVGALLGKVVNNTTAIVTGTGLLTLSEETRNIKGGFIMVDGDVEINCAFETLVRLQRESMEKDVAKVLFD
jgi:V/A-type H+-transporting ATPase subunit E